MAGEMDKVTELLRKPFGARYWRVDLHVHTPGSRDTHESSRDRGADDVVATAMARGLEVIAVTDHNSVEWCEPVREAAGQTPLIVLPGIEISTREGHLLAVFDSDKPIGQLRELLIAIGIREADFGSLDIIADGGIDEVAQAVAEEAGVAIAAHVAAERGFFVMAPAGARRSDIHACEALAAFETNDTALAEELVTGGAGRYPRSVACIQGSDSWTEDGNGHRIEGIGSRYCHIKMDGPSVRGLLQAFIDPEVRVKPSSSSPRIANHVIEGVFVNDGFLENQLLRFNPNISCLIGGTGAGKSATLELIRFALDQQVDGAVLPAVRREVDSLLNFAMNDSTTVSVVVRKGEDVYLVERVWRVAGATTPTVSRVSGEGTVGEQVDGVYLPTFFPIKAFSQSEIIEYAREPLARLTLLDDLLSLDAHFEAAGVVKGLLRENAVQLTEAERQVGEAQARLSELPTIEEQIRGLDRFFSDERVRDHPVWYQEREILENAERLVGQLQVAAADDFPQLGGTLVSQIPQKPRNADVLEELRTLEDEIRRETEDHSRAFGDLVSGFVHRLQEVRHTWDDRYEEAEREYRELLVELDKDGLGRAALASKLEELRTREQRLRQLEDELRNISVPRVEALRAAREQLLDRLQTARRSITIARQDKARELTKRLEARVRVSVKRDNDGRKFLDALRAI